MDIDPGNADPVAVARLERARDMLDRAAAERLADERLAAAQRSVAAMMRRQTDADREGAAYSSPSTYDFGYPLYPAYPRLRAARHRASSHAQLHGFAPNPSYVLPRR